MTAETDTQLDDEKVEEALRLVIDPELGYNIVDLGLVYAVLVNAGADDGGWTAGAALTFAEADLPPVALPSVAAGRGADLPRPMILAGAEPYLAFDVLYDPERRMIGLRPRPRPPARQGPKS